MRQILLCLLLSVTLSAAFAQKNCVHQAYQQQLLAENPQLSGAYEKVEAFTRSLAFRTPATVNGTGTGSSNSSTKIIAIPVVVHVLWNNSAQNISNEQILSQIEVLNNDYRGKNEDHSLVPSYFASLAADCGIQFTLAKLDPNGNNTTGIIRKQTGAQSFSYNDYAKKSAMGGDDPWDADSYLNIWVCSLADGILGYSSVPGGPKNIDGVVISTGVFGTINVNGPFNKGRTTVHEIGHWLNLRHIWGDASCGDDKVDDTPTQQAATRGCPGGAERFSCGSTEHGDMYMNYMDFTDDACMFMFSNGQRDRMRALFEAGGVRSAILVSNGLKGDGLPVTVTAPDQGAMGFNVDLYPNPTTSSITIHSKEDAGCIGKSAVIYNYLGQMMKTVILQSSLQQVDVSNLKNGLYFIKIDGVKTKAMTKFVKQ